VGVDDRVFYAPWRAVSSIRDWNAVHPDGTYLRLPFRISAPLGY